MDNDGRWTCTAVALALLTALGAAPAALAVDSDGDGVDDSADNCSAVANPDQRDSNGDGFGNICDPDLNDDLAVNFGDLLILKSVFFGSDPDADFNGDGPVNFGDLSIMKEVFFGAPGPGAVPAADYNQRALRTDYDLDNNGVIDATGNYVYDPEGRLLQQTLTLTPDSTPDNISAPVDSTLVRDFGWYDDGLLEFIDQDFLDPSDVDVLQVYSWDASRLQRLDITLTVFGSPQQQYVTFVYDDDQRIQDNTFLTATDQPLLVRDTVFDAAGLVDTVTDTSQFDPTSVAFRDYSWNASGQLAQTLFDFPLGGAIEETAIFTQTPTGPTARAVSGTFDLDAPFTEFFVYDGEGKLVRIETDAGSDGGVDAVKTVTWETGPCQVFLLPEGIPTGGGDGNPDSGYGDLASLCAP